MCDVYTPPKFEAHSVYHSRDLYILPYVVNINLMPEISLEIEISRSVKMNQYNSSLTFVLN